MAEYMNPFAGSMLPESVPNNPFMSRMNQLDNQEMMSPFMGMEKQRQEMALRKQGIVDNEFMSPEATAARKSDQTTHVTKNKLISAEADAKWEALPYEQKVKIGELKNKLSEVEGSPQGKFLNFMTDQAPALEKAPPQMRAAVYDGIIKNFQMTHPGIEVQERFRQFSPEVGNILSSARLAQIATPKHIQKLEELKEAHKNELEKARISAGGTTGAAAIHEQGAMAREQLKIKEQAKQNPGQFRVAQRKVLTDPKATPEEREAAEENLSSALAEDMPKLYATDHILNSLSTTAMGGGPAAEAARQKYDARKSQLFEDHTVNAGIRVRVVAPDGKTKGTLPRSKLEAALKAGYKEVKSKRLSNG